MRNAKLSAIVAALGMCAATLVSLGGCGQRGPLYLPSVPPMPQRPAELQDTPPSNSAQSGEVPNTSGQALQLAPETELKSAPNSADAPKAASSAE
jgi:predicted small lipoprotein YifL